MGIVQQILKERGKDGPSDQDLKDLDLVNRAMTIAEKAFEGIRGKEGEPYIEHIKRVHNKVKKKGGDEEQQVIALLHDLVEDIPDWTIDDVKDYFPNRVVKGVKAITKRDGEPYMQYINRVQGNKDATVVKLADLEDNIHRTELNVADEPDETRFSRLDKYKKAYERLSH